MSAEAGQASAPPPRRAASDSSLEPSSSGPSALPDAYAGGETQLLLPSLLPKPLNHKAEDLHLTH